MFQNNLAGLNFDAAEHESRGSFEPLPDGKYVAVIANSEMKPTKAGTGQYLELTWEVIAEGEHKGRKLWSRLNLVNPNNDAVQIAKADLGDICRAVNVRAPKDSMELHDRPVELYVVQETRKDTGQVKNEIKGYFPTGAVAPTQAASAPALNPLPQAAPAQAGAMPWNQ